MDERVREAAHDGEAEGRADQLAAGRRGGRHADGCPGGRAAETRPQAREGALESEEAADRERRDDGESDRLHQVLVHDEVAALGPVLGETDERGSRDVVEAEQQRAGDGRRAGEGAREEGEPDEDEAPDVQKVDDAQHRLVRRDPVEDPREEPAGLGEVPGRGPAGVRDLDEALVEKVPAEAHPEEDEQDLLRAAGGPGRLFVRHAEPPARGPLAREASRRRAPRVKRQMAHVDESLTPRNARAYDPVTLPENAEPGACRRSSSSTTTGRPATCSGCSCGRWAIRWTPRRTAPGPWRAVERRRYDLVLLDVWMPGMDGLEVLGRMRQAADAPRVVVMTADDAPQTVLKAIRQRAYRYVTKPIEPRELGTLVTEALVGPARGPADRGDLGQARLGGAARAVRPRGGGADPGVPVPARVGPARGRAHERRPRVPRAADERDRVGRRPRPPPDRADRLPAREAHAPLPDRRPRQGVQLLGAAPRGREQRARSRRSTTLSCARRRACGPAASAC